MHVPQTDKPNRRRMLRSMPSLQLSRRNLRHAEKTRSPDLNAVIMLLDSRAYDKGLSAAGDGDLRRVAAVCSVAPASWPARQK